LNTLLVEPTTILDVATVNGKTYFWTLGIVFTNTGSRIGPSGKAYCIVTIGTLTTGASITIMLFGTSYLTYCRTVRPGMVIALINPRLLSPRTNDRTSSSSTILTFSVTDNEQLLVVGDAQDYGRCKATTSSKNELGQWIPNSKACNNYVDKRQGEYCTHHRKQQRKKSDIASSNSMLSGKTASIQQLRTQAAAFPTTRMRGKNILLSDQMNRKTSTNNNNVFCKLSHTIVAMNNLPPSTKTQLATIHTERRNPQLHQQPLQSLQNRYTPHQSKNPLLVEKKSSETINNSLTCGPTQIPTICNKSANPYSVNKRESQPLRSNAQEKVEPPRVTRNALSSFDILQQPQKHPRSNVTAVSKENKRRRLVNTDTSGFNGSVPIPAPAKIFSQKNGGPNHVAFPGQQKQTNNDPLRRTEDVIVQQQMIASQLQACTKVLVSKGSSNLAHPKSRILQGKSKSMKETLKDDLFGSHFDSNERENIINSKSQFISEVEAEEYARSRRVVCELEEQESKVILKAHINNHDGTSKAKTPAILKEWYCFVCKKHFGQEPIRCRRLQHGVKLERSLRATTSKVEERLTMTEAKTEDGGLVLGTGLDWSRFPSSRFS
jgi:Primase zinc finger